MSNNTTIRSDRFTTGPDYVLYVAGNFTTYKGVTATRIIRLNADGTVNGTFNSGTGFSSVPDELINDSNNKLYAVGSFNTYDGFTITGKQLGVIRLNLNGTRDSGFDGKGFPITFPGVQQPKSIAIDSNGKIYVGGSFTDYNGITENGIIRLNPDGTKDTGFDNSTGFNVNVFAPVDTLVIDSNGKIYAGGGFTTYKGVAANYIIRLNADGTKDTGFDNTTGFDESVNILAIDSNGKIYVGGSFTTYKGATENRIIRLNPDGSKDTGFDNSTGFDGSVNALTIDSNGKIYVGGTFSSYKGSAANRIIRLNPDGSKDTGFDNSVAFFGGTSVNAFAIDSNGKLYVGGNFTVYKGVSENYIIRLNPDGSKDTNFNNTTGFNGTVSSFAFNNPIINTTVNYAQVNPTGKNNIRIS